MYKIACKDMGMDCPFVAEGQNLDEAMLKLKEHGQEMHGPQIQEMMDNGTMTDEAMMEKMKSVAVEA